MTNRIKMRNLDLGPAWKTDPKFPGCYFSEKTIDEMKQEPGFDQAVEALRQKLGKLKE